VAVEVLYLVGTVLALAKYDGDRYKTYLASVRAAPIIGLWELDAGSATPMTVGGVGWYEISIDSLTRGMARSADGQLWRMYLTYDEKKHTVGMASRGGGGAVLYEWQVPDPQHMVLVTVPPKNATGTQSMPMTVIFHRVVTPKEYPLLTRGFHLVNEWGYER